jgi:hypothetical protein
VDGTAESIPLDDSTVDTDWSTLAGVAASRSPKVLPEPPDDAVDAVDAPVGSPLQRLSGRAGIAGPRRLEVTAAAHGSCGYGRSMSVRASCQPCRETSPGRRPRRDRRRRPPRRGPPPPPASRSRSSAHARLLTVPVTNWGGASTLEDRCQANRDCRAQTWRPQVARHPGESRGRVEL